MGAVVVILILVAIAAVPAAKMWVRAMRSKRLEQELQEHREKRAKQKAMEANAAAFVALSAGEWAFHTPALLDGKTGAVMLNSDATKLRFLLFTCTAFRCDQLGDLVLPIEAVRSLRVEQQTRTKVVAHDETMPVAVMPRRKAGLSAAVGGLVAGEVGAIVGAASSLGQGSTIEHHTAWRKETVSFQATPKVIVGLDDLTFPSISIEFDDEATTNEWLSRIDVARMKRNRPAEHTAS